MNVLASSNVWKLLNVKIWNFADIFIPTIYNASSKMGCERSETKLSELAIWTYMYQIMCENYLTHRFEILHTSSYLPSTMQVQRWLPSEARQSVASLQYEYTCIKQCVRTTQRRDLKFCTHLHTYHLQVMFENEIDISKTIEFIKILRKIGFVS